jgi:hypothetical protein
MSYCSIGILHMILSQASSTVLGAASLHANATWLNTVIQSGDQWKFGEMPLGREDGVGGFALGEGVLTSLWKRQIKCRENTSQRRGLKRSPLLQYSHPFPNS